MPSKLFLAVLAVALLVAACGPPAATSDSVRHSSLALAPASALSPELRQLPSQVQEAYRFAVANPDVLETTPCYCGCGRVGHTSNLMCYIKPESTDGQVVFDYHGAG